MSAERPHGQMIGDDNHPWHDPWSWDQQRKARLARGHSNRPYEKRSVPA